MMQFRTGDKVRVLDAHCGVEIVRGVVVGYTPDGDRVQVECNVAGQTMIVNYPESRVEAIDGK